MSDNLVSIIMPSYNASAYISESIECVLHQTYRNWELLIVDDCSTDETGRIVSGYLSDDRIHYFQNEINMGAALSRNAALREAKGRWIAFLDSDDLWTANKLEKQISFMEENAISFSYTAYEQIDEAGTPLGKLVSGPRVITKTGMYRYCWPGCLTVMFDKSIVGLIQIKNCSKHNDYLMWLYVIEHTECHLLPECLAYYRLREGSISRAPIVKKIQWHYLLFRYGLEKPRGWALLLTLRNLFFGVFKKLWYVKRAD